MSDVRAPSRRRTSPLSLLVAGLVLMSAAVLSLVGVALTHLDGHAWADDALVPLDGRPHAVTVDGGRTAMVWAYDADVAPACTAVDASGARVALTPTDGSYLRDDGTAGDWVGTAAFEPGSDRVEVTCTASGGTPVGAVAIESAPRLPPVLDTLGPWSVVPALLGTGGVLALVAGALLLLRRRGLSPR